MKIFGYEFNKTVRIKSDLVRELQTAASDPDNERVIQNLNREIENAYRDLNMQIDEISGTDYRVFSISDWLDAMRQADQPWNSYYPSNWVKLEDIFSNMTQDAQVQAATDVLRDGIQEKEFYIVDQDGEKLEEVSKWFNSKWYYDFLGYVLSARLRGFQLIQIESFDKATNKAVLSLVNRKHVRPDLKGVVRQQYDQTIAYSYEKAPIKNFTIEIFESKLGKYNACVRWWIYKTEISRIWAKFNQMFGVPPVIAKTSIKDNARKTNMVNALKNWITSRWMVIDEGDEITTDNNGGGSSGQTYFENLMRFADEQISKALVGSTMVLDDGSSRSQGEVHERNTQSFIKSVSRLAGFITNDELIPRLRNMGMPIPQGAQLVFDNSEKLTMLERAQVVSTVSNSHTVSAETATNFIGIEVTEKENDNVTKRDNTTGTSGV